jgi:hypothetical protein
VFKEPVFDDDQDDFIDSLAPKDDMLFVPSTPVTASQPVVPCDIILTSGPHETTARWKGKKNFALINFMWTKKANK